ncbi:MAG: apolipoprotein N-acyltransferase [Spirochaetes bacterium]|nr:apolipoprotein N-acyltransferase [Spirochaetota bacterium]
MKRLLDWLKGRYYLLTAVLMFLSFPSFDSIVLKGFPFFAWLSLVPLIHAVRGLRMKDVFTIAFVTGFFGNLFTYHWIGNFGRSVPGGPVMILSFLIPSLTVFFTVKIFIAELLSRRFGRLRLIIYPSVWIIVEWIQSIGFIAFPMPFWGYSQYPVLPFIQIASITGIMGVTFILIMSNAVLAEAVDRIAVGGPSLRGLTRSAEGRRLGAFILFLCIVFGYGALTVLTARPSGGGSMRVAVVQSCIDPWKMWVTNKYAYLDELKKLTEESLSRNPDFLIWSESATLEPITYHWNYGELNDFERDLIDSVRRWGRPLLTGEIGVVERWSGFYVNRYPQNNAVLLDASGVPLLSYAKIFLVPFGEWFPYERVFPFLRPLLDSFGASRFVPGERPVLFELFNRRFGVLICYEGIFHRLCRTYRNMGAQYFVNITNDGWTHSYSGHMQHFAVSVFRAVENGIWYVRAGNTGYTVVIDPYGRQVRSIPIWEKGALVADLDFGMNRPTVYSAAGDLILYFAMVFVAALSIKLCWERMKGGHEKA